MRVGRALPLILIIPMLLGGSGCASARKKEKKEKPAPTPQPVFVGTISLVNEESKFVLIDGGMLPTPPPDLLLKSYTRDLESAELISGRERRRPFVIADIKSGVPKKGDRVFTAVSNARPPAAANTAGSAQTSEAGANSAPAPDFLPSVQLSPAAELDQ